MGMAEIVLPDTPGVGVRRWAGDDDFALAAILVNVEMVSSGVEAKLSVADVRIDFENTTNLDLAEDFQGVTYERPL